MKRIWMAGLIGAGWLAGAAVARAEEASATVVKTIQIDGGGSPEEIAAAVQKAVQAALTNLPSGAQVPAGAAQVKVMYEDGAEVDPSKKAAMVQAVHAALGQAGIWQPLFNGRDLDGWRASENTGSFSVVDGAIKVFGPRSHLFYTGPVNGAAFTNFEFEAEVMTKPGANSGIFIHTAWQESGWPKQGYEAQVNNSMSDPQRTGGLYNTVKINPSPAQDNAWFSYNIKVEGKHVTVTIDGKTVVDYTEPEGKEGTVKLSSGTFALQAHDPKSEVYYRNIRVRPLP